MLNSKVSRQPRKLQIICQLYKLTRHGFEIEIFDCPSQSLKVILYPHSLSPQKKKPYEPCPSQLLTPGSTHTVSFVNAQSLRAPGSSVVICRCGQDDPKAAQTAICDINPFGLLLWFMHLAYQHIQSGIC